MLFKNVVAVFEEIEKKTGRLEMTNLLLQIYNQTTPSEAQKITYFIQGILAPSYSSVDLGMGERFAINALAISTGYSLHEVEKECKKLGDLGLAAELFLSKKKQQALANREMEIDYVYAVMLRISKITGAGSQNLKIKLLVELLNNTNPSEGKFIVRFVVGQLRLGVGDSTILDTLSIAKAGNKSLRNEIERAYNLCSDLGLVAKTFIEDQEKTKNFKVEVFKPIRPALAERLATPEDIVEKIGECAIEFKFDGFRMQIHKKKNTVEIYSRKLERIAFMYPDIVEEVKKLKNEEIIFEGEAVAFNEKKNKFYSFQETMHRRRKYGIDESAKEYPLYIYVFDLLYVDGMDFTQKTYLERRKEMEKIFPSGILKNSEMHLAKTSADIEEIFNKSIEKGLEGIMAKDPNAFYIAGARKFAWIKLKKSYGKAMDTIDATIVGYYLGKGTRAEFEFGGLLVAVYNPEKEKFETIAKIGSGYNEEEMKNLEEILSEIKINERPYNLESKIKPDFWTVPKYVVEIAFDDITISPTHTCGMKNEKGYALRFPRMMKIRLDKGPKESTTTQEIIEMHYCLHETTSSNATLKM